MMKLYQSFNATEKGYSHIRKGTVCEDASTSYDFGNIHIAVVADGHGDPTCFRSNIGSRMICDITQDALLNFAKGIEQEHWEKRLFDSKDAQKLLTQLFATIIGRWTEGVLEQLQNNPWTEDEIGGIDATAKNQYETGSGLSHIYGTTLVALLMTKQYLIALHQGDGRCVIIHENGEIDQPVPWDDRCEGRYTTSICDTDALSRWRYHIIDLSTDKVIGCFAITDGVEDSFETMEDVNSYVSMLAVEYAENGRTSFLNDIGNQLSTLSEHGSGDDISLACIINPQGILPYAEKFVLMRNYLIQKAENRKANERLNSMQRKMEYLESRLKKAKIEKEDAERKNDSIIQTVQKLLEQLDNARKDQQLRKQRITSAVAEYDEAQQEYDMFMQERNEVFEREQATRKAMEAYQQEINLFFTNVSEASIQAEMPDDDEVLYTQTENVDMPEEPKDTSCEDQNNGDTDSGAYVITD